MTQAAHFATTDTMTHNDTRPLFYVWLAHPDEPTVPVHCALHGHPLRQLSISAGPRIKIRFNCSARCFSPDERLAVCVAEYCDGLYRWNWDDCHFAAPDPLHGSCRVRTTTTHKCRDCPELLRHNRALEVRVDLLTTQVQQLQEVLDAMRGDWPPHK